MCELQFQILFFFFLLILVSLVKHNYAGEFLLKTGLCDTTMMCSVYEPLIFVAWERMVVVISRSLWCFENKQL